VTVAVRPLVAEDWPSVRAIHAEGIATGNATFEPEPPSWEDFDRARLPAHRFVALDGHGSVIGWVAVSPTSSRPVYSGVVEHSVYVARSARRGGVARRLLEHLVASTEADGIWTIQSSVFPENEATIALHMALGFRIVGTRERIALMSYGPFAGRFRDTVLLERRSGIVGGTDRP
jgi:phosphinothricin acetyltransferase